MESSFLAESANGVVIEGGDPGEAVERAKVFVDTGLGDHAAIADEDDFVQAELLAKFDRLIGDGGGVANVTGEDFATDGAPALIAE